MQTAVQVNSRKRFAVHGGRSLAVTLSWIVLGFFSLGALARAQQADVLVYGATPGGIAAALAAAEDGEKVLLVERSDRIGGLLTNGLSHADFRTFEALSGAYLRFTRSVEEFYRPEFGEKAAEVTFRGTHAEPKVNLAILEKLLADQPLITVQKEWSLEAIAASSEAVGDEAGAMRALEVCLFADANGDRHSVPARFFIDATYEGDLMAAAGAPYQVGREAAKEFGEKLAPREPDAELQAYNFRFCMTQEAGIRVPVRQPANYDREEFAEVVPLIEQGQVGSAIGETAKSIFKTHLPRLPHGKVDIDDMPGGPVRLSLPGSNDAWPDGGGGVAIRGGATSALQAPPFSRVGLARTRASLFEEHLRWSVGLLYFLQNDPAVPEAFRKEASTWGWCRDEFKETRHVPDQLYIREARRLQGMHVYTENDVAAEPGDARSLLHRDAIAIGDYGLSCQGTAHEGSSFGGVHTGEFHKIGAPYQIPYGVLAPRQMENLLVVCAASASHGGFSALRYEPVWMSLGEAAGHAVHLARKERVTVQAVPVTKLQTRLHQAGGATVYVSDVPPGSPDFAAVQWWGTLGGWHGLEKAAASEEQLGKKIVDQYCEAFPRHAAQLEKPMDADLTNKWKKLVKDLAITEPIAPEAGYLRRGEYIRKAWIAAGKP